MSRGAIVAWPVVFSLVITVPLVSGGGPGRAVMICATPPSSSVINTPTLVALGFSLAGRVTGELPVGEATTLCGGVVLLAPGALSATCLLAG